MLYLIIILLIIILISRLITKDYYQSLDGSINAFGRKLEDKRDANVVLKIMIMKGRTIDYRAYNRFYGE